ncbi:MAG TPA: SDR family oxidoreductase [Actinomycetota bacterium]|jgi:NAD(P)-dependent dehydrogenase (short-subunit alcohol dehydrogenase family)|nr:SDR family oxidoreductase [Actinomycetota bacterium]
MTDLGRVVLITGGAGGIGRAVAERFLERGDLVTLADRSGERLLETVADLAAHGDRVDALQVDVREVAECRRMVEETVEHRARLDVLVNCAGVWVEGPTAETTEEDWDRTIDVNLKGTFFACRFAIPHLERTEGCIVNLSSDAGLVGTAETAVYCASKGGVSLLTKSLALELAPKGVRVNAVCPNDVDTPMLAGQARDYGDGDPQAYLDALLAKYPQRERARFIRPEEVAALIVYLASPEAAPITGACIPIDFGSTAGY